MNYYGYIYMTINLINGKMYIGKHKYTKGKDNYLGSGKYLINSINKYGRENFSKIKIEECKTLEELNECEKKWIWFFNARESNDFYNIASGGDGGVIYLTHPKGFKGRKHNERTRKIQSETMKKVNELGLNTNWKNGHPKGMLGKKQTPNQKEKVGNGRVKIIYPNGRITEHLSLNTASEETGIPRNVLRKIDKDKKPYIAPKNFQKTHTIYNGIMIERI